MEPNEILFLRYYKDQNQHTQATGRYLIEPPQHGLPLEFNYEYLVVSNDVDNVDFTHKNVSGKLYYGDQRITSLWTYDENELRHYGRINRLHLVCIKFMETNEGREYLDVFICGHWAKEKSNWPMAKSFCNGDLDERFDRIIEDYYSS